MHTASTWLPAPRTSSRCDLATRPACRAQARRPRHVPANQQQGVWQTGHDAPALSTAAAAAASMQEILELRQIHLDVRGLFAQRRISHAAADTSRQQCSEVLRHNNGRERSTAEASLPGKRQVGFATSPPAATDADALQQQHQAEEDTIQQQEEEEDMTQHQHLHHLDGVVSALVQDVLLHDCPTSNCSSSSSGGNAGVQADQALNGACIDILHERLHSQMQQVQPAQQVHSMQHVHSTSTALLQQQTEQQQIQLQQQHDLIQQPPAATAAGSDAAAAAHQYHQQPSAMPWNAQLDIQQQQQQRRLQPQQDQHGRLWQLPNHQQGVDTSQQQRHQQQKYQPSPQQQQQLHWQHQVQLQQQHASMQLSQKVAAAASWQEVGLLLTTLESKPLFGPKHVVQLLLRLEQLVLLQHRQQQQVPGSVGAFAYPVVRHEQAEYVELVHMLLRMATAALPTLQHSDIACLAASAARLPTFVTIPKPWCVRLMTRAHHMMSDFSPTSLAVLTWALGKLNMGLRSDFSDKLLRRCRECIGSASPRALSLMLHGMVGLKVRPDGLCLGVIVVRTQKLIPRFNGWELSMTLWGLVRLRCSVPRSLLTAALSRLIRCLPDSTNHEVALTVWAIGRLGYTFSSSSSDAGGACSSSNGGCAGSSSNGTNWSSSSDAAVIGGHHQQQQLQVWQQGSRKKQIYTQQQKLLRLLQQQMNRGSLSPQDLTTLLYGLALMHSVPNEQWSAAALAAAERGLGQLDGQGLSNLLYAVGLLKWQPSRHWQLLFWNALVTQIQRVQPVRQHQQQQKQKQHKHQRGRSEGCGSLRGVRLQLAGQQQQLPGLSCKSWEQLHESQRLLGWRLPLHQLQRLQEQQQSHRITRAQLGSWALQVQQHLQQQQQYLQEGSQLQCDHLDRQQQQQQQQRLQWVLARSNGHGVPLSVQQVTVCPPTTVSQPATATNSTDTAMTDPSIVQL